MKNSISIIGLIFGMIAFIFAIFQNDIARIIGYDRDKNFMERTIDKGREMIFNDLTLAHPDDQNKAKIIYMTLGIVGLIFSIISFIRKEEARLSYLAAGISVIAISWSYVLIGIAIAVVILILSEFFG